MKKNLFHLFFFVFLIQSYAHDVNKVNFTIEPLSDYIKVTVDLPWTLKNALEIFDPSLKIDKSRTNFDVIFKAYVNTHFIIWSKTGNKIPLKFIKKAPENNKHIHGAYFNFFFDTDEISKIENTFLFETSSQHKNYNSISINSTWIDYQTSSKQKSFDISSTSTNHKNLVLLILAFLSISTTIVYFLFK